MVFNFVHRKHLPAAAIQATYQYPIMLIIYCLAAMFLKLPIDNAAHVGGFVFGILAGFAVMPRVIGQTQWRLEDFLRVILVVAGLTYFGKFAIEKHSDSPAIKAHIEVNKGSELIRAGKYREALSSLNRAARLEQSDPYVWSEKATAYRRLHLYSKAIDSATIAIKLDPENKDALLMRGESYQELGNHRKAIGDFNAILDLNHNMTEAWSDKARSRLALSEYDRAVLDATKATDVQSPSPAAYDTLGLAYMHRKQYEDAMEAFNKAIGLDPKDGSAYYYRSLVYKKRGKRALADQDAKQARALGYAPEAWERQLF